MTDACGTGSRRFDRSVRSFRSTARLDRVVADRGRCVDLCRKGAGRMRGYWLFNAPFDASCRYTRRISWLLSLVFATAPTSLEMCGCSRACRLPRSRWAMLSYSSFTGAAPRHLPLSSIGFATKPVSYFLATSTACPSGLACCKLGLVRLHRPSTHARTRLRLPYWPAVASGPSVRSVVVGVSLPRARIFCSSVSGNACPFVVVVARFGLCVTRAQHRRPSPLVSSRIDWYDTASSS